MSKKETIENKEDLDNKKSDDNELSPQESDNVREFMKENRLISIDEDNENLKVENPKGKTMNLFAPIKWIAALYIIGALGTLIEFVLVNSKGYVYTLLTSSELMISELSTIGNILRAPFIMLLLILPFVIPGIAIFFLTKYISDRFKLFTDNGRIIFLTLLGSMLSLMTILSYL